MNTDHVIGMDVALKCHHCSAQQIVTPMPIACMGDVLRGFLLMHRRCEPVPVPSPQLPLPPSVAPGFVDTYEAERAWIPLQKPESVFLGITREAQASVALDHDPDCGTRVCVGIDGSSDEPDPETDPPPPDPYAMFDMNYPKAEKREDLREALMQALTPAEIAKLEMPLPWDPRSGQFEAVAHWARVENAHNSAGKRPPTAGLTVPKRFPMPLALAQALAMSQPKALRKKATTRKAKA